MKKELPNGIWPTMLTPFDQKGELDLSSLKRLTEWYIDNGADGLFAVCQSSEMFFLSLDEKFRLAQASVKAAAGRVPVICSGHTSESPADQREELSMLAESMVDALVLLPNRLAAETEGDDILIERLKELIEVLDIPLGLYECPYPYKRLISAEVLDYCISTGRFIFLKDTSCSIPVMRDRIHRLKGSGLKLYNANAATLLRTVQDGAAGYCGVMANFVPHLYREFWKAFSEQDETTAEILQDCIGPLSLMEKGGYPLNAKIFLKDLGVLDSSVTRNGQPAELTEDLVLVLEQAERLEKVYLQKVSANSTI